MPRVGEGFGEGSGEGDIGRWRTPLLTREQLMSDDSHAQLTVRDNLHDREPTNQIRSRAAATYDLQHPTDEHVTTSLLPFATDRASQHTHVQQVAGGIPVDRCGEFGC